MYTIIFDMDGTLLDTEIIWYEAWVEANKKYKLNLKDDFIKTFIGMPKQNFELEVMPIIEKLADYGDVTKFRRNYFENYLTTKGVKLKPGVFTLLKRLKDHNYKIGLCTSTFKNDVMRLLEITDIYQYFDVIVTGDLIVKGKPDPEIYLNTLRELNESASNCIAVEDSEYGIKSATSAGIKTYYVKDINDIEDEVKKLIVKELKQIDELLEEIN